MPFRRKSRNPVSRPEKENEGIPADQPLSPRLIRCKSDSTHRTCSEISLNKSPSISGGLSPEAKMSNLKQLNAALVKEVASLRRSNAGASDEFSKREVSLRAENGKLTLDLSSLEEEASSLKVKNSSLLKSQEELLSALETSRAHIEGLSMELATVKAELSGSLSTQKQALAASEERLASTTRNLMAVKEHATLIISEKDGLFQEKDVALRDKAEMEDKLDASCKKERELEKLLQLERNATVDAEGIIGTLRHEIEKLLAKNEDLKQKGASHEKEATQKVQLLEVSLDSYTTEVNRLTLDIGKERETHAEAMKAVQQKSAEELSQVSAELMAANKQLQESKGEAEALLNQITKAKKDHQADTRKFKEKLFENSQKLSAMEELIQESNASVEALRKQLTEDSSKHQLELESQQEKLSAMVQQVSSVSTENEKLLAKKESLHKELSRVNQKVRATFEQLVGERKVVSDAQKSAQVLEEEITQLRIEKHTNLEEVHQLKRELSQCAVHKAALLLKSETLFSEKVSLEAEISSLTEKGLKLLSERKDDQRVYAEENQKLLTELKKVEGMVSDLEIEQNDLLKQLNVEKMAAAAAQDKIAALESSNEALSMENFNIKNVLCSKESEMATLHEEVQTLGQLSTNLHELLACSKLERQNVEVEMERAMSKLMQLEVETLELSSSKKLIQQNLEEERADVQSTMLSLQHEIDCLHQSQDQLVRESTYARSREDSIADYNKQLLRDLSSLQSEKAQLEMRLLELSEELVHVRERAELAELSLAKQHTDMEQLQFEISKLASANTELISSMNMKEEQAKLEKGKQSEQIAFLSRLSAELEVSHGTLEAKLAEQKATCEALRSDNSVLQSSIETKAKAILALESQVDDSAKRTIALKSRIDAMSSTHSVLELRAKSLEEESIALNAALDAERHETSYLQSTLEEKSIAINSLEEQLAEAAGKVLMMGTQLEETNKKQAELESAMTTIQDELGNTKISAACLQDQAMANLECLRCEKNNEISSLKAQLDVTSQKNTGLFNQLKACSEKKGILEAQFKSMETQLAIAKEEVLNAEKEVIAAGKREGEFNEATKRVSLLEAQLAEFNEATKRVSLLEAQLTAKATMQNELEFQVISLQNDLQAARTESEMAEKDWLANMEAMRESANARSRALEEQLETVKQTLDEMQTSANKGQESIASLQTQLSCLMEEKSTLEKKVSLHPRALHTEELDLGEAKVEVMPARKSSDEKAKFARLVLPVFLISAASSLVIAGIQSYMKQLEN